METARPVACTGSPTLAEVAGMAAPSTPGSSGARRPAADDRPGAFIWCTGAGAAAIELGDRLEEVEAGSEYCEAFTWEPLPPAGAEVRRKARWTLQQLGYVRYAARHGGLEHFDRRVEKLRASRQFDPETARLLRELAAAGSDETIPAEKVLAERLGPSPDKSCDRLEINLHRRPANLGDTSGVLMFSVRTSSPAELSLLGAYLCRAGCRLSVLPAAPEDRRLDSCY